MDYAVGNPLENTDSKTQNRVQNKFTGVSVCAKKLSATRGRLTARPLEEDAVNVCCRVCCSVCCSVCCRVVAVRFLLQGVMQCVCCSVCVAVCVLQWCYTPPPPAIYIHARVTPASLRAFFVLMKKKSA